MYPWGENDRCTERRPKGPLRRGLFPDVTPPPLARPRLAAVRSLACQCVAGNWLQRFLAASSVCAIHNLRVSSAGACRACRRSMWALLVVGAVEFERRPIPAGRSWTPDEGGPAAIGEIIAAGFDLPPRALDLR